MDEITTLTRTPYSSGAADLLFSRTGLAFNLRIVS